MHALRSLGTQAGNSPTANIKTLILQFPRHARAAIGFIRETKPYAYVPASPDHRAEDDWLLDLSMKNNRLG